MTTIREIPDGRDDPMLGNLFKTTRKEIETIFPEDTVRELKVEYTALPKEVAPVDNCRAYEMSGLSIISITAQIQKGRF